jgi:hypothetical protein
MFPRAFYSQETRTLHAVLEKLLTEIIVSSDRFTHLSSHTHTHIYMVSALARRSVGGAVTSKTALASIGVSDELEYMY